jgi:poly(A) polymerase
MATEELAGAGPIIRHVTFTETVQPTVLPRSEHPISRKSISSNALKVLYRLRQKGFTAYLVGGSVRDLLLGREPKDYDVGTDARPHDVRRLFRNSRVIGRRFRLVHVFFQGEIVEVSTFRGAPEQEGPQEEAEDGQLLVLRDNTYGTPAEDAFRRDFTVNALFYDIADFTLIDYVGGMEDLHRRLIRVIGDPNQRFAEDPVRMMRACEYAGRLAFGIDTSTQVAIQHHRSKLGQASPARVTEEVIQLLRCGSAGPALQWMLELGLLEVLLPEAYAMVSGNGSGDSGGFATLLPAIDRVVRQGREPSDAALLSLLLLPQILQRRDAVEALDQRPMRRSDIRRLTEEALEPFGERFALSKKRSSQMLNALVAFHRMCEPGGSPRGRVQLAQRPYFEDALHLFELMVEATGEGHRALERWQAATRHRAHLEEAPSEEVATRRRRPRRRRRTRRGRARTRVTPEG